MTHDFLIQTPDGVVRAADVKVGDVVLGWDGSEIVHQTVTAVIDAGQQECAVVGVREATGTPIVFWEPVSATHKVLTPDGTKLAVEDMEVGSLIGTISGEPMTVAELRPAGVQPCLNFTVEPNHVYLGADGTLHCNVRQKTSGGPGGGGGKIGKEGVIGIG